MPMSKATRFISLPEAGRRLGKSPRSVKRLIATGKLQAISIPGTHARVSLDQVESYVPAKLRAGAAISELVRLAVPLTPA
jgi:excisionase family DNA binding protein